MNSRQDRFTLAIERLVDSDMLTESEAAALIAERLAASRSLAKGDTRAARQHIDQVAQLLEALIQTGGLALVDGRAVIQAAERILDLPASEGAQAH
jgi:hypothetical protein